MVSSGPGWRGTSGAPSGRHGCTWCWPLPEFRQRVSEMPAGTSLRGALEAVTGEKPPRKKRKRRHKAVSEPLIIGTRLTTSANRALRKLLKPFEPQREHEDETASELGKVPPEDTASILATLKTFRWLADLIEQGLPAAKKGLEAAVN